MEIMTGEPRPCEKPYTGIWYLVKLRIESRSSDELIAISMIVCGVLGSFLAAMLRDKTINQRDSALGIGAGFLAFLFVKGGRMLFIVETGSQAAFFNPYSTAFLATLVGLYRERVFEFLTENVEKMIGKETK